MSKSAWQVRDLSMHLMKGKPVMLVLNGLQCPSMLAKDQVVGTYYMASARFRPGRVGPICTNAQACFLGPYRQPYLRQWTF